MKEKNEIIARLNDIFRDVFDDETITVDESTVSDDVEGWDSLTHITLIAETEAAFGMKFTMKEVIGMHNVGEMIAILMERAAK